jgi:serine/threonine-protein kinase HipA
LLPEGPQLEAILRLHKIDRSDCFRQLITVGQDLVGSLTIEQDPAVREEEP